jgi:hypothetical protein
MTYALAITRAASTRYTSCALQKQHCTIALKMRCLEMRVALQFTSMLSRYQYSKRNRQRNSAEK